jgi:hypothetical protein
MIFFSAPANSVFSGELPSIVVHVVSPFFVLVCAAPPSLSPLPHASFPSPHAPPPVVALALLPVVAHSLAPLHGRLGPLRRRLPLPPPPFVPWWEEEDGRRKEMVFLWKGPWSILKLCAEMCFNLKLWYLLHFKSDSLRSSRVRFVLKLSTC